MFLRWKGGFITGQQIELLLQKMLVTDQSANPRWPSGYQGKIFTSLEATAQWLMAHPAPDGRYPAAFEMQPRDPVSHWVCLEKISYGGNSYVTVIDNYAFQSAHTTPSRDPAILPEEHHWNVGDYIAIAVSKQVIGARSGQTVLVYDARLD